MSGPGFLTQSWVADLTTRVSKIQEQPFKAFQESGNMWWPYFAKVRQATGKKEVINWILSTAYLENLGQSTDLPTRELTLVDTTFIPENAGERIEISLNDFEDLDGGGIDALAEWTTQVSLDAAHYPQRQIASLLENGTAAGTAAMTYDSTIFFSNAHPLNPRIGTSFGTFANIFTGAASSTPATDANDAVYPGAVDLTDAVSLETSFNGLIKIYSYIASIRQANNIQPRFLKPWIIGGHPKITPRIRTLLKAKFLSMATSSATTGGGSTDVEGILTALGYSQVVDMPELTDTTSVYIGASQIADSQLGATVWVERKAFGVQTFWPVDGKNADLGRKNVMEAQCRARNIAGYGKPELLFKVSRT